MTQQPEFMQGIPKEGTWKIAGYHGGQIEYQQEETGRSIRVPNIWYNQPVASRINVMESEAARVREQRAKFPTESLSFEQLTKSLASLERLSIEMQITGKVLA